MDDDAAIARTAAAIGELARTRILCLSLIHIFSILDPSAGYNTCAVALESGSPSAYGAAVSGLSGPLPGAWAPYCSVAHFTSANLYVNYAATDHLSVHGSVTNLFNSDAPIDLQTYGGGAELHYDAALDQDGAVGRFFMLGATYRF